MNVSVLATWHILQGFTLQLNRPLSAMKKSIQQGSAEGRV